MTTPYAPAALDIIQAILRPALPGVTVRVSIPDNTPDLVPLVVIRRTGGASSWPRFWDRPTLNIQCWADADRVNDIDASRAAANLADQVRRALWEAFEAQTVTSSGHISRIHESLGPMEIGDADLPHLGRYSATYQIRVRPAA